MRYAERNGIGVSYPDAVTFAFLPNILEITGASGKTDSITIAVKSVAAGSRWQTISVPVFGQSMRVDISHLLQSCLFGVTIADRTDVSARCADALIQVVTADRVPIVATSCAVMWGSIEPFSRIGQYGLIKAGQDIYRRAVRYFKNYPFTIECITGSVEEYNVSVDGGAYGAGVAAPSYNILSVGGSEFAAANEKAELLVQPINRANVWDNTFDATFGNILDYCKQVVEIAIDGRKQGYYLRWIDAAGLLQYYLFAEGTDAEQTKDSGTIAIDIQLGGMYYNDGARVYGKTRTHTKKICASLVPDVEQNMVQSIGTAIVCDLYSGKDSNGLDIWLPVVVKPSTLSIRECRGLQDIEIEIELPTGETQRL